MSRVVSNQKSLKEQNAWLIRTVLLIHAIAFAYIAFDPFPLAQFRGPEGWSKIQALLAPGSISLGIIALARLVLLGLVPAKVRDRLIHWRWHYPLPGARAFTKIGPADARVDLTKLKKKYGALPTDPAAQAQLFYSICRAHGDEVGVLDAHKSYLAARDIGTINFLLLILLPPLAYWATADISRTALYAIALFIAFIFFAIAGADLRG